MIGVIGERKGEQGKNEFLVLAEQDLPFRLFDHIGVEQFVLFEETPGGLQGPECVRGVVPGDVLRARAVDPCVFS